MHINAQIEVAPAPPVRWRGENRRGSGQKKATSAGLSSEQRNQVLLPPKRNIHPKCEASLDLSNTFTFVVEF